VGGLYAVLNPNTKDPGMNARVSAALLYAREAGRANLTILSELGYEEPLPGMFHSEERGLF